MLSVYIHKHSKLKGGNTNEHLCYFSYPTNGRDFDQEEACKALIPGEKYQLQNAFVGRSNTKVLLRDITGYFNSVMFDFVDGNGKPVNIYEMPQFRMY